MASTPPVIRVQEAAHYHAAQQAIIQGFSATVFNKDFTAWRQWQRLCSLMQTPPDLKDIEDPIPFLQIFFERVRSGLLSAQGQPIKKRSVEQYLRSIGQIFASVGANNPRHNHMGKLYFRLVRLLASYQKKYSPPKRVRPLLVSVIQDFNTAAQ